jgi:hypothetical protein
MLHSELPNRLKNPTKVRGWLLFFCISLAVLSPVMSIRNLYTELLGYSENKVYIQQLVSLNRFALMNMIVMITVFVFSTMAGLLLWAKCKAGDTVAKLFLLYNIVANFLMLLGLRMIAEYPELYSEQFSPRLGSLIYASIYGFGWYSYLIRSSRVKTIFPRIK